MKRSEKNVEADAVSSFIRFTVPRAQGPSVEFRASFLHPSELNKLEARQRRCMRVYSPISPRWPDVFPWYV